MSRKRAEITGERFGRLVALKQDGLSKSGRHLTWLCQCDCGNQTYVTVSCLRSEKRPTKSCGCLKLESTIRNGHNNRKHGMDGTPEYKAYYAMLKRCYSPNNPSYAAYGERGISVCERWLESFENFFADIGLRPGNGYSLERIDVNGNYEPSNCKWATIAEQNRNRRDNWIIEYDGRCQTLSLWAEEMGIGRATIAWRIKNGWEVERAMTTGRYGWSKRWHG